MQRPSTSFPRAILEPFQLMASTASRWLPVTILLTGLAGLPEVVAMSYLGDLTVLFLEGDPALFSFLGMAALVLLLIKLIVQLVLVLLAYLIFADVAAGRTPDLWAGLRRTTAWRLQLSWLFSSLAYSAAASAWFCGAGLLLFPFALAVPAAYEEESGLAAFGRSAELSFRRTGPTALDRVGWKIAVAATVGLLSLSIAHTAVASITAVLGIGPGLGQVLEAAEQLMAGRPPTALTPSPTQLVGMGLMGFVTGPFAVLPMYYLLALGSVMYADAKTLPALPTELAP